MSELDKKVPEDSDWLFGYNTVSRINQIIGKQQALTSDVFKNSKRLAGILQKPRELTERILSKNSQEKDRKAATTKQRKLYYQKKSRY